MSVLHAVTQRDKHSLVRSLDAARSGALITHAGNSPNEFVFTHELLRDALYRKLPESAKRDAHLAIAASLERQHANGHDVSAAELAFHYRCALPESDPRKVLDYAIQAATSAAHVFAYADSARHLKHALESLDLVEDGSPRLRLKLMMSIAYCVRHYEAQEFLPLVEQVIRLATRMRVGDVLARAALLLSAFAGFPSFPGWHGPLRDSLAMLPTNAPEMRACILTRLALSGPAGFDATQASTQLEAAQHWLDETGGYLGEYMTLDAKLFFHGGPERREQASALQMRMHELAARYPSELAVAPIFIGVHSAIVALQDGDQVAARRVVDRMLERTQDLSGIVWWHMDRFRVLCRVNANGTAAELTHIRALCEAENRHYAGGSELLCAYDRSLLLGEKLDLETWPCLRVQDDDAPNIWALKARSLLAGGLRSEAQRALFRIEAGRLAYLPRDRDYLGTLGALAHVAVALDAREYIEALHPLLSPHLAHFAVSISFLCEGSVATLVGMLANALGRRDEARDLAAMGIRASEAAGYTDCAATARQLLASYSPLVTD